MPSRRLALSLILFAAAPAVADTPGGYAIVVSGATMDKPEWKEVVRALFAKPGAWLATYDKLEDARVILASRMPRYACFVATPAEATREFVGQVHRLTRKLDADPYTDVIWGILTGYD